MCSVNVTKRNTQSLAGACGCGCVGVGRCTCRTSSRGKGSGGGFLVVFRLLMKASIVVCFLIPLSAVFGPTPLIVPAKSQPHSMQKSTNCVVLSFNSSSTLSRWYSSTGCWRAGENVSLRTNTGDPQQSASMSSVAVAYTIPALHSAGELSQG
jgi:hypothetical protein